MGYLKIKRANGNSVVFSADDIAQVVKTGSNAVKVSYTNKNNLTFITSSGTVDADLLAFIDAIATYQGNQEGPIITVDATLDNGAATPSLA